MTESDSASLSRVLELRRTHKETGKTETETYYYGNGLLYEKSSEYGLLVYHYDHLGSTTVMMNDTRMGWTYS